MTRIGSPIGAGWGHLPDGKGLGPLSPTCPANPDGKGWGPIPQPVRRRPTRPVNRRARPSRSAMLARRSAPDFGGRFAGSQRRRGVGAEREGSQARGESPQERCQVARAEDARRQGALGAKCEASPSHRFLHSPIGATEDHTSPRGCAPNTARPSGTPRTPSPDRATSASASGSLATSARPPRMCQPPSPDRPACAGPCSRRGGGFPL
jgi:hypothetical protein